jgi:hypothetical protein
MKWFKKFVAGKSVVLEDARDVGMHGLVVTNSSQRVNRVNGQVVKVNVTTTEWA